ncbi:hypothetical protein Tco_0072205 [Tanacetum coccineum]
MLLAKEETNKILYETILKNNNQPPEEKSIVVLLYEESIRTVMQTLVEKQIDTESMQELLLQFFKDLPTLGKTFETTKEGRAKIVLILETSPVVLSNMMAISTERDEHLNTISETDSDEEIESSIENLNLTPSEFEDLSNYIIHLVMTRSSFPEEDVPVENFKIYSNPLLEFDEEIFSSEINPLFNEIYRCIDSDGYDSEEDNLFLEYEPDPGELTRVVVEELIVETLEFGCLNVLPTHPTICQDLDFTLSTDFSGSDLVVSFFFQK